MNGPKSLFLTLPIQFKIPLSTMEHRGRGRVVVSCRLERLPVVSVLPPAAFHKAFLLTVG